MDWVEVGAKGGVVRVSGVLIIQMLCYRCGKKDCCKRECQ